MACKWKKSVSFQFAFHFVRLFLCEFESRVFASRVFASRVFASRVFAFRLCESIWLFSVSFVLFCYSYRCSRYSSCRCRAALTYNEDAQTYNQTEQHNHPDDRQSVPEIDFLNFCRSQARETATPLLQIYLLAVDR